MTPFWTGVVVGSVFWIAMYALAAVVWAIWDARQEGAEMGCTEAANDRPPSYIRDIGGQSRPQTRASDLAQMNAAMDFRQQSSRSNWRGS